MSALTASIKETHIEFDEDVNLLIITVSDIALQRIGLTYTSLRLGLQVNKGNDGTDAPSESSEPMPISRNAMTYG